MSKHCETCICGKRAPVQETIRSMIGADYIAGWGDRLDKGPGTISWSEYLEAYSNYSARYGTSQSAERLAERGGMSYYELIMFLGRDPVTWSPIR